MHAPRKGTDEVGAALTDKRKQPLENKTLSPRLLPSLAEKMLLKRSERLSEIESAAVIFGGEARRREQRPYLQTFP